MFALSPLIFEVMAWDVWRRNKFLTKAEPSKLKFPKPKVFYFYFFCGDLIVKIFNTLKAYHKFWETFLLHEEKKHYASENSQNYDVWSFTTLFDNFSTMLFFPSQPIPHVHRHKTLNSLDYTLHERCFSQTGRRLKYPNNNSP